MKTTLRRGYVVALLLVLGSQASPRSLPAAEGEVAVVKLKART